MNQNMRPIEITKNLLKEHGIRYVVVSPGGTNMALVHVLQDDPFFTLYSIVDERSAIYFIALEYEHLATVCEELTHWLSWGSQAYTSFRAFAHFLLGPDGRAYIDLFKEANTSLSEKEIEFLRSLYDYNVKLISTLSMEGDVNTLRSMSRRLLKETMTEAARELNTLFYRNPPVF